MGLDGRPIQVTNTNQTIWVALHISLNNKLLQRNLSFVKKKPITGKEETYIQIAEATKNCARTLTLYAIFWHGTDAKVQCTKALDGSPSVEEIQRQRL